MVRAAGRHAPNGDPAAHPGGGEGRIIYIHGALRVAPCGAGFASSCGSSG